MYVASYMFYDEHYVIHFVLCMVVLKGRTSLSSFIQVLICQLWNHRLLYGVHTKLSKHVCHVSICVHPFRKHLGVEFS